MNKETIVSLIKVFGGIGVAVAGTIASVCGIKDLAFEKREIGDLVQETNDAIEEVE